MAEPRAVACPIRSRFFLFRGPPVTARDANRAKPYIEGVD
jgi:hypothetical protein